jgi:tRNA-Thr(GGU) m(6)t(6)A37 methyltransferase TsaA
MTTSRRQFVSTAVSGVAGAGLAATWAAKAATGPVGKAESKTTFTLVPIGRVEVKGQTVRLRIFDEYVDGLLGLDGWSHVNVLYWFDRHDTPQQRRILRVHPRGNAKNPLTGVFACRAPVRPNLIALSVCKLLSVEGAFVSVEGLDAFDGTPVLDLKPFIPPDAPTQGLRVPAWAREGRPTD